MSKAVWGRGSVFIGLDSLPEKEIGPVGPWGHESLVRFGGVTPAQRPEKDAIDSLAARHEEIAAEHLAAARWLREEYRPEPRPVYRDVVRRHIVTVNPADSRVIVFEQHFRDARMKYHDSTGAWPETLAYVGSRYGYHSFEGTHTTKELVES